MRRFKDIDGTWSCYDGRISTEQGTDGRQLAFSIHGRDASQGGARTARRDDCWRVGGECRQDRAGPSFPNHLVTVAAGANHIVDNPTGESSPAWGCDSGHFTTVHAIDPVTGRSYVTRPCFDLPTIVDELEAA